ncbi:hypothetical protein ACBJ59_11045 [Nonomuraea sp. MTCD27]|uniref:hypothetical protein n=1 Tax=Nonomuraea sp. MTCD27 TaxID=1676747 RepID=UPI0035BEC09D
MGKTAGQPGDWLRQELTRRGYDLRYGGQSQFAREADMHVSIVNRALQGKGVTLDVLRRMGKALGYNVGEMLVISGQVERDELPIRPPEELEDTPSPEPDTNPYTDPQERQIWAIDGLSDDLKRMLITFLKTMRADVGADEEPAARVTELRRRPS